MKKRRILRSERGFTLVELGIVMAIIAILAAVAYPTYTGMRKRAYEAEAKAAMQEVRVEAWACYVEKGNWPTEAELDLPRTVGKWTITAKETTDPDGEYTLVEPVFEIKAEAAGSGDEIYLGLDEKGRAEFGKK